jgi:hypothetical protein
MNEQLLGPLGGLALALVIIGLLVRGTIVSKNAVPREDYKALQEVNASYAEGLKTLTKSVDDLVTVVRTIQKNGGA